MKILNKLRKKLSIAIHGKKADGSKYGRSCMHGKEKSRYHSKKNVAKAIYSMSLLGDLAAISVGNSKMFCRTWG